MKKIVLTLFTAILALTVIGPQASAAQPFKSDKELKKLRSSGQDYEVFISEEQAVERVAELTGKTEEEVREDNAKELSGDGEVNALAATCGWMETLTTVTVTDSYKPKLSVIVKACRDGSFGWLQTTTKPFYQGMVADSKKFEGDVRVELQSSGFYYLVNGRYYNNGTVTHTGTTGANTVWTATYSVSSSSNFYKSVYTGLKYRKVTP